MPVVTHRDCRALRHAYERMDGPGDDWVPPHSPIWSMSRYVIHLRCMRCGTWRHVAIDRRGGYMVSNYTYPEDYLMPKGEPRVDRDQLRLWLAVPDKVNGKKR